MNGWMDGLSSYNLIFFAPDPSFQNNPYIFNKTAFLTILKSLQRLSQTLSHVCSFNVCLKICVHVSVVG